LLGGVSKFITSDIFTHLQQRKASHHSEIPTSVRHSINILEARIKNTVTIATTWISPSAIEEDDKPPAIYGLWRKDYCDNNSKIPIFKVNSHQLNKTGENFNKTKRCLKLTPNLSLLNMNHHADEGAELGHILYQKEATLKNVHLRNPPSALRFFYSWEGATVDTHISEFIKYKIFNERLDRLKTKKIQGLLWRSMEHVSATWEELGYHKGWRSPLMGLSKTHTRSLYKSETYRSGCHLEMESNKISHKYNCITPKKQKDIIKKCANCMWCPNYNTHSCPEENRNHLFLQCQHPDLASYRTKMTNSLEQKLRVLLRQIQNATNEIFLHKLIRKMEIECLALQSKSLMNKKSNKAIKERITYIKIEELMQKYEITNM